MEPSVSQTIPLSHKGVVGLQNMGNTCYCNSTLQLLRACSEWNAYCLMKPFMAHLETLPQESTHRIILLAYQDLLTSLWSAHYPAYVRPSGFLSEVSKAVQGTVYSSFGMPVPNDSHEYLVYVLDQIHEALRVHVPWSPTPVPETATPTEHMRHLAQQGWNQFVSKNSSEVVRQFFGMMRKTITCSYCHQKTYKWEIFNSIKIPCEGATFYDWIQKEVNEVSEIEDYQCDNCSARHPATIISHLWKLPPNLFITIRRFHYNGDKNMTPCPYQGENLSLARFFAPESEDLNQEYELRGISDHHGSHLGGHYTAQFKHPISEEWWWFDDQTAQRLSGPQCSSSNYIFVFKRI